VWRIIRDGGGGNDYYNNSDDDDGGDNGTVKGLIHIRAVCVYISISPRRTYLPISVFDFFRTHDPVFWTNADRLRKMKGKPFVLYP